MKSQFSRYILVGVFNTLLGYAIIFTAMYKMNWNPIASNVLGYVSVLIISFFLNRNFTFKSSGKHLNELIRFLVVFVVAFAANLGVLFLLIKFLFIQEGISQVIASIVYIMFSYIMNKYFVFRKISKSVTV